MKCKISITAANDLPVWVTKVKFEQYVNQEDLALREAHDVIDCYHPKWFLNEQNGDMLFIPPAFEFRRGQLYCINGRHRTVLLLRHLSSIPILLVNPDKWPKANLNDIIERKIEDNEEIELPNLPINHDLPNSEKTTHEDKKKKGNSEPNVSFNIKIDF
jgi:hypothetical protein